MTVNELNIELECYKNIVNKDCDVNNLTKEELAEFITYYLYIIDDNECYLECTYGKI